MSRFMNVACLVLTLGMSTSLAAEPLQADAKPAAGMGFGALVGGLIAGPPGALVGAAGGAWLGTRDARKDQTIEDLEAKLNDRTLELARLRADFDRAHTEMLTPVNQVASRDAQVSRGLLSEGLSLPVFFRTDNADIEESLKPHLTDLGKFLKSFPELNVHLEGYADQRGDSDYNMELSRRRIATVREALEAQGVESERIHEQAYGETQARGQPADADAMAFDRTVIISLSIDSEVFASSEESVDSDELKVASRGY